MGSKTKSTKERARKKTTQSVHSLEFIPLGGADEVGRSCYLVGDGKKYVMLDCGESPKSGNPPNFDLLEGKKIIAVLISHSHRDHVGALPSLFKRVKALKVFSTELTKKLSNVILQDAIRVKKRKGKVPAPILPELEKNWRTRKYGEEFKLDEGITATFKDAGHIPGSAQILLNWGGIKIHYTGDVCGFKTRMSGEFKGLEKADVVISESTYGKEFSKPSGAATVISEENKLIEDAKRILQHKGRILIPCFANGRAQEIMYVIADAMERGTLPKVPCYSIGMLNSMLDIIGESNVYREKVAKIQKYFVPIRLSRAPSAKPEEDEAFRTVKESKGPSIIVSTPGMLTIGASSNLAVKIFDESRSAIFIVGYQDEDSPGRQLEEVEKGRKFRIGGSELEIKCKVKKYEIRGHIHPKDLMEAITNAGPKFVFFVHGDLKSRNAMKQLALLRIKKCRVFSGPTHYKFDVKTGKYQLIPLPWMSSPKIESFVVDGWLEEVLEKELFEREKELVEKFLVKEKTKLPEEEKAELSKDLWNCKALRARFGAFDARIVSPKIWMSVGGYPKKVRFVVEGEKEKISEAATILQNPRIIKSATGIDWIIYDGKAKFNDVVEWLRRYEPKVKRAPSPIFDSFPLGEGLPGFYKPVGRIFVNPIVAYDENFQKTVLYHEIAHHVMDFVRHDLIELVKKYGFMGKAFVEGAAEYIAYKLGGDRIFIETEKIGDDGVYYPTSKLNPYVFGWYMYKTIDEVMGEKRCIEILLSKSPETLRRTFTEARIIRAPLILLLGRARKVGRLYLRGAIHGVESGVGAMLHYAAGIDEGRLFIGKRVWVVKNFEEDKSILYRLGKFFGIIREPWLKADCIREIAEKKEDFSYKVPPHELLRIEVGKLCVEAPPEKKEKLSHTDKRVLNYIVKHGGKISVSKATRDLHISANQLRWSIERLKRRGKIAEK